MGSIFGSLTALSIGLSDLFGRRMVVAHSALMAATTIQFVSVVFALIAAVVLKGSPTTLDLAIGGASGVGMGLGLGCYYIGISKSTSTIVSPLVGTLSAVVPFLYVAITRSPPSQIAVVGAVVAFAGLALVSSGSSRFQSPLLGIIWGTISGLGYGFGISILIEVSPSSGSWPVVSQRIVAGLVLVAASAQAKNLAFPRHGVRGAALAAGTFAACSSIFFIIGSQANPGQAVVTASMFPAVSVGVGRALFGDTVSRNQLIGLIISLIGVAGVVAG